MHEPIVNLAHALTALAETLALLEAASRSNAKRSSEHLVDDLLFPARDEVRLAFVGCGRQVTHPTLEHSLIDAFDGEALPVSDDHRQDAPSLGI